MGSVFLLMATWTEAHEAVDTLAWIRKMQEVVLWSRAAGLSRLAWLPPILLRYFLPAWIWQEIYLPSSQLLFQRVGLMRSGM